MSEPSEFNWTRDHERYHLLSKRTAVEKKWAVPVERSMDSNPRLLHEALAAAFILRKHRSLDPRFQALADETGTPDLDQIRDVLAEHAGQIRPRLAALQPRAGRKNVLLSALPSDYVSRRTEHDVAMFQALLKSEPFKKAILAAAGVRSWQAPPLNRTKREGWTQAAPCRRGRPRKNAPR